ncbi:helix-turn-helix transcriptional regulator [Rhizobium oryzicola]|uniref:Helix-turn-helix transcriptional regulator n=2 Tax=Rhizobium oryzicola TaxID=1232668 RepID=A0ABT8T0H4_9HYPH|nr:helix-turn-helix transcriptional regulator [Rhizobium oryzicola]MDO1584127.1 helix-turn-helix transcriptional regulator [Rhizobium oryzicola]
MLAKSLANPPSQAQLARAAGVSQRRLVQAFRTVCNTTIFGHLRQIRLQTVRRLVEETDMPLKQIAFEIGYGHANNLIAAYRDYYGEPPRRHVRKTTDA